MPSTSPTSTSTPSPAPSRRRLGRSSVVAVALASGAALLGACTSDGGSGGRSGAAPADATTAAARPADRPRVGVILGGGGETGIAWQTAVLSALADDARLTRDSVDVVVGTSAGAIAGAYFSSVPDLGPVVEELRKGGGISAPAPQSTGTGNPIPADVLAALGSTEGTVEERSKRIGALAIRARTAVSSDQLVNVIGSGLPDRKWPALDFRATSVHAETGETVLWKKSDGVPLAAAVASSAAVPGYLPAVKIKGQHYTDAPRTSFSVRLVREKKLDAVVYIGMPTPNLSNTIEEDALTRLEGEGLKAVRITGGKGSDRLIDEALDPEVKPLAVEIGLRDGADAAPDVAAVLKN
ncbi:MULTISPECIES: patatin-like phospholipase family protein [unclassified Streptomyces]|uniref:patatin-like phospholipase family protein n=1 Tax=unclassified Streptomyces TaxID=2593676 RepID=UPI003821E941